MTCRLTLAIPVLALVLTSCSSFDEEEPAPPQPVGPVVYGDFAPIWDRMQIEPNVTLLQLIQAWGARSGMMFTADEATRVRLAATDVGLVGSTSVAAPDVHAWVGGLLLRQGFVMADLTGTKPSLVGIYPVEDIAKAPAIEVAPARLADFERVPAVVIQTTLQLSSTDVRTVTNSLRSLSTGAAQAVPVGNTNQVRVRGAAREVIDLANALRKMDEEARLSGVSPR